MKKLLLIGGSPCSGKSTVAEYISEKYDYQLIRVDDYMDKHIKEATKVNHPILTKWREEPWHELFSEEVDVQLKEEIAFYEEEWPMLKRDILNDINQDHVIIEGCALMPSLIHGLDFTQTLYMVPTEEFQVTKYKERTWAYDLVRDAVDPNVAFNNWMKRDIEFAKIIKSKAIEKGYSVIEVNGIKNLPELFIDVENHFKL